MKLGLFTGIVVAMAMFVCVDVKAQSGETERIKDSILLTQAAALGGQQLEAGTYEAEISGGEIVLRRDRKEVARARVKRAELPSPAKYDRVDLRVNGAGVKDVATIYFKGERGSFTILGADGVAIAEKP